ncbi:TPA: fructose-6-phosphate aldolase [Candidatus Dependentiae bacterium]|nr:MAG: putative transaldolase [candidate division TM6 bacterium GW2011_GWE2_31_21]KKP53462.1 MAG: putative transaldolase [candidate division TM6 bacterium GW2011_GWF2_33_332]HBS48296.1 fructose-6-phosphate aldolase [Candidatus Dependentiae bacterium]HBZ73723.1 fructose-6-phosphate aldolase [Candidatus Dependentiae bacterium]
MKLFLDTADRQLIKKWVATGVVDGVTTNPTLLSKEGNDCKKVLLDICSMVSGDVSIEVVKKTPQDVYKQALEISKLADNVVVKIPFHQDYLPVIAKLVQEGVEINVTLIFSLLQSLLVAKLGVKYISPFVGRWDDIDINGITLIGEMREMFDNYGFDSLILAASLRHLMHWHDAALAGADIATIPPKLLEQVMNHPLTEKGIAMFDADWQKLNKAELLD